jgi:2-polyprenyl-6-methoxyphenol hydroxylase-like FAD-dependent oxidoreductase
MASRTDYDVIIVGARPAGAATALLLARAGLRVLAVDQARFPSDTLSTHQVQLPGVALLARWGLLGQVTASGCPPARDVLFDAGPAVLRGRYRACQGADAVYSPRRTVLDKILLDAARAAGAETAEGLRAGGLARDGDGRVTGITAAPRGPSRAGAGPPVTVSARLVIGADGKHSTVARAAAAREYRRRPALSAACYAYWSGLPVAGGEVYQRTGRSVGAWPTNDGQVVTFVAVPAAEFGSFRADLENNFMTALDLAGDLGERARDATRRGPLRATSDLPNAYRVPHGPGWALAGDAGLVMDPVTGQGIGLALRDADELARAVTAGLGGAPLDRALAAYHKARDARTRPMYEFTAGVAALRPHPAGSVLFPALAADPERTRDFLGVLTGTVDPRRFFSPGNLARVLGPRGMLAAARAGKTSGRGRVSRTRSG